MEILIILAFLIFLETTALLVLKIKKPTLGSRSHRKVYVDTSALMDGRILAVAKTGFFSDDLIIPRSVIREMQTLADGKDSEKRMRARAGMDVVNELERIVFFNTEILQDELDHTPVDERLIALAKENHGVILTNDFNLGKVAKTEKIDVLNINDLALTLRSDYLPGDRLKIKIISIGSNPKQGVGYLPDGTMAVVDNASKRVGEEVEVEFVRFLQTSAGRMMFGKPVASRQTAARLSSKAKGQAKRKLQSRQYR